jgi:uncharacterized protein YbaP (TraB family)
VWIAAFSILCAAVAPGATGAPAGRSFIWKATSPDHHSIYLVGSVHLLTKDFYPLNPALETAFKDSDLLVEEADLGEMLSPAAQMTMLSRGMLDGGRTLDEILSPDTYATVSTRAASVGLPMAAVSRLKPWTVAFTLLALEWKKAGFDPELGLDKHFYDLAKTAGTPVEGLETAEFQIAQFDGMTLEQQEKMLVETMKELDTETGSVTTIASAWKAGDAPAVERLVLSDVKQDPEMYQRLLVARNRNWMPKIQALFSRPGHAFVVVGAAHLVGPDGLLAMLRAKGYTLEQL